MLTKTYDERIEKFLAYLKQLYMDIEDGNVLLLDVSWKDIDLLDMHEEVVFRYKRLISK